VLQSSSKFIADTLKGKNFLDILGAGNKQLADDISYIVTNISEDPSVMRLMADDISDLSKKFKTATAGDSTPGVKDIQNALDAAANVSKKSKEGFANISTNPDAVVVKSEDLTTKTVDATVKSFDDEINKAVDELGDDNIKTFMSDITSKLTDEDKKLVDESVASIPKGKEEEYIQKCINGICGIKESRNFNKILNLITEDLQQNCNNAKTILSIWDKKGRPGWAILKIFGTIFVAVAGGVFLWDSLKGFFSWKKSGYEIDNPLDDTDNTDDNEEVIGGGGDEYDNDPAGYKKYAEDKGGTYGTEGNYVFQDGKPYYKDSDGNWQEGSHDGKTFITN